METFALIILAILAAVVLFWLVVFPACSLFGIVYSVLAGAIRGLRR